MITLTNTQVEKYLAAGITALHEIEKDEFLPLNKDNLKSLDGSGYTFTDGNLILDTHLWYARNDNFNITAQVPFSSFIPKQEAEYLHSIYEVLIGKVELATNRCITEMKVDKIANMRSLVPMVNRKDFGYGLFAKVTKPLGPPFNKMLEKWVLVDNTAKKIGGIPNVNKHDFDNMARYSRISVLAKEAGYMTLEEAFIFYHQLAERHFSHYSDIPGDIYIDYREKSLWEECSKWDTLAELAPHDLYIVETGYWSDGPYSYRPASIKRLRDFLAGEDSEIKDMIRNSLGIANAA